MRTQAEPGLRPATPEALLAGALALRIALQPIVRAHDGRVVGHEALLRGEHALGFTTPPALLDHAHLLSCLAGVEAMLHIRAVESFAAVAPCCSTLYLNLDGRSLAQGGLAVLAPALWSAEQHGIPRDRICIELGETHRGLLAPDTAGLLRAMGLRVALDDLGSGFSEIRSLAGGAIDVVKLDRVLVAESGRDQRRQDFLAGLVRFAHGLGAQVVAEGVETAADCAACRAAGVDLLQGWFIARPEEDHPSLARHYPQVAPRAPRPAAFARH
jgi:EAL domain-containing protein (putative c-di-GMP-specific phosphodiesterase class I)